MQKQEELYRKYCPWQHCSVSSASLTVWRPVWLGSMKMKLLLLLAVAVAVLAGLASAADADQDPWKVLGVRRSATKGEITRAFRKLSREWHPDKNSSPEATERFQSIAAAYERLTDPTKAKTLWETPEASTSEPYSTFTATFGTVQYVLDLDPKRLGELLTAWTTDWAANNWKTFGPLWHAPVDESVCWCMENAWRLPKVTEPLSRFWAGLTGVKHREGAWRAWRLSGALLEFSAWSSRQAPCLQHRISSSASTQDDVLAQLQQQLSIRRKARRATVEAEQRRRNGQGRQHSSSAADTGGDSALAGQDQPGADGAGRSWVVWATVLVVVAGLCASSRGVLVAVPLAAAAVAVYCVSSGTLLPDEAAVQQLAAIFEAGGTAAALVGTGLVLFSLTVGVLLPLLLASVAFVTITWVWAAASTLALASTPAISQCSLALWFLAQAYFITGGGDPIKGMLVAVIAAYGLFKAPKLFKWWFSLLTAPLVLVLAFAREVLRSCGLWWPAPPPKAAPEAPETAAAQQAAAAAVQRAAAADGAAHSEQPQPGQQAAGSPPSPLQQQPAALSPADRSPASPEGPSNGGRSRGRGSGSSSGRQHKKRRQLLPDGAWWPRSFGPVHLAQTCHWYTSLLGWHLATQALDVAVISCKLTALAVLLATTSASLGDPLELLTLRNTVLLLLLRGGVAAGLLWKLRPLAAAVLMR